MTISLLLLSLVIFLFTLYTLSRDDFVFIRKNITLEEIFNISFLVLPFIFFFSRLLFVLLNFDNKYLNPLAFLAIWYYSGLSLLGTIIGLIIGLILLCALKKIAVVGRVLDVFSLSLFSALVFGVKTIGLIKFWGKWIVFGKELLFAVLFIFVFILLIRFFLKEKFKDGSLMLLLVLAFCILTFMQKAIGYGKNLFMFLQGEGSILLVVIIVCSIIFIRREKVGLDIKKLYEHYF